ncbi:MAG: ABC-2 transporter permease [Lachnospiraceae bacterium]|nr:ABC-2 transporter permease [Lachnospiraceae bacterium]
MAGLFDKDLRILLQRKQAILLFLAIAVVLGFSTGGTFVVGYTAICFLMLSVGTISYDEFDNGYSFLMTLPITRRTYILEKYLLSGVCGIVAWIVSVVICICESFFQKAAFVTEDFLVEAAAILPVVFLIMCMMIPVQIKYGAEKSRVVLVAVMGIAVVGGIGIKKAVELLNLPLDAVLEKMYTITDVQILVGLVVLTIAAMLLSFAISVRIMYHKEF